MQERRELEDNYVHFKTVFGSHSPTKPVVPGSDSSPNDAEDFDESNPFFEDDRETNPFATEDDDDDESAKNPFS